MLLKLEKKGERTRGTISLFGKKMGGTSGMKFFDEGLVRGLKEKGKKDLFAEGKKRSHPLLGGKVKACRVSEKKERGGKSCGGKKKESWANIFGGRKEKSKNQHTQKENDYPVIAQLQTGL